MLQGYYSAASAMSAALQNQDILAQNLANFPVSGYRRQSLSFQEFVSPTVATSSPGASQPMNGTQVAQNSLSFTAGPYQQTGNPLECAIQDNAPSLLDGPNGPLYARTSFFVLDGPNGPLYTRNGQFQLGVNGQLISASGYPVSSLGGPINIPPNAANIQIAQDGTVSADNVQIGQLRLASFNDPTRLQRVGTTLFTAPDDVTPQTSTAQVRQGYREGSNVAVVNEMVHMLVGMRQYEAASKALRSLSDAMQQRINGQM